MESGGAAPLIASSFRYQTTQTGELFIDVGRLITPLLQSINSISGFVRFQEFWDNEIKAGDLDSAEWTAIKAKEQAGHEGGSNMWDKLPNFSPLGAVLTRFKNAYTWVGWKRTASVIIDSGVVARVGSGVKLNVQATDINKSGVSAPLTSPLVTEIGVSEVTIFEGAKTDDYAAVTGTETNGGAVTETVFYRVQEECKRPIYIEWRNSLGAFDQHMFSVSQAVGEETQNDVIFDRPITQDLETALDTVGKLTGSTKQTMTIQAAALSMDQLQAISEIKSSDEVYVYLSKDGAAKVRIRAFGNQVYDTKNRGKSFEVNIDVEFPDNFNIFAVNIYDLT
jgi:hypothetical protein